MSTMTTDKDLETLLAMAIEADELASDSGAPAAAGAGGCLPMSRLDQLGGGPRSRPLGPGGGAAQPRQPDERRHLADCARCRQRLAAFSAVAAPAWRRPRLLAALSLAAACLVVLGVAPWRGDAGEAAPVLSAHEGDCARRAVDFCLAVLPGEEGSSQASATTVRLELEASTSCVAVAILRAWDDSCQCLRTSLHEWPDTDGTPELHSRLRAGQLLRFDFELPGLAPTDVEQHVLVVTAADAADLPADAAAADMFVECFDERTDGEGLQTAASTCLATPVCVTQRSFFAAK